MKTENVELMRMARETLRGKWGLAIGTFLLYLIITGVLQAVPGLGVIVSLLISGPMALGITIFSLSLSRNQTASLEQIFKGFNYFTKALGAYLLILVYVVLWMLLLIVPGIIKALSYSMTFYILADNPSVGAVEALDISSKMMEGNKSKLFRLGLRFFGWLLLCIPTMGIGLLWLIPYVHVTMAKFYDDVKGYAQTEVVV